MKDIIRDLEQQAVKNRLKILDMVYYGGSGHIGGAFSAVDILTYFYGTQIDFEDKERDRFLLSKGHAVPALYSALNTLGIIKDEELRTFRHIDSRLQGHTNRLYIPETEITTGLLGQGLSYGVGMAFGKKIKNSKSCIYVMVGDGEMHEGQIWEALMEAGHYKLDNLILIIDRNGLCSHQAVENVISIEPLRERIEAFGWYVTDMDGHNMSGIDSTVSSLKSQYGKPKCIIAHTIKGKGVRFMENNGKWHRSIPNEKEYKLAKEELLRAESEIL